MDDFEEVFEENINFEAVIDQIVEQIIPHPINRITFEKYETLLLSRKVETSNNFGLGSRNYWIVLSLLAERRDCQFLFKL